MKKSKESLCELWDTIKKSKLQNTGVPENERKGAESLFKEIISQIQEEITQVYEAHTSPNKFNSNDTLQNTLK